MSNKAVRNTNSFQLYLSQFLSFKMIKESHADESKTLHLISSSKKFAKEYITFSLFSTLILSNGLFH